MDKKKKKKKKKHILKKVFCVIFQILKNKE